MNPPWYCEIDGRQFGPMDAARLKRLAAAGKLRPTDLVWREGMQKKKPAQTVKGLFQDSGGSSPPPPQEEEPVELEVLETVEEEEVEEAPPPPARKKPRPRTLAEIEITYREGYPDLDGPFPCLLLVQSDGLCFCFESDDEEEDEFFLAYDVIEDVLPPAKGEFPKAMLRAALGSKIGGKAGQVASGLLGSLIGGTVGNAVGATGKGASRLVEESGDLGRPPRNRMTVLARVRKKRRRVVFDTFGKTRDEMEEEANHLHRQIREALSGAEGEAEEDAPVPLASVPGEEPEPASRSAPTAGPAGPPGTSFRVLSGGRLKGPFPLADLPELLASGEVGEQDLIGLETWLPAATVRLLGVGVAPARGAARAGAGTGKGAGAAPAPVSPAGDEDAIPVDKEFHLD
jgi:hypothetical protein